MKAATIKIFLAQGNPNGLRTAELSNWTGKAISSPRTELKALTSRQELQSPGIYLLTGEDPSSGERTIYIGEAENVTSRLPGHKKRESWNAVTVFVSKDDNLTKAHIRYLEGRLIQKAKDAQRSIVENSVSSGAKLPESDAAEMDIFLQNCLQLLPVLGISDFIMTSSTKRTKDKLLYCMIKGLTATGMRTENGFTVFKNSQAVLNHRPSADNFAKLRDQLVEKGVLNKVENHFVFARDMEFGSPSTAAAVVRGGNSNGLHDWRNVDGVRLRDLEASET